MPAARFRSIAIISVVGLAIGGLRTSLFARRWS